MLLRKKKHKELLEVAKMDSYTRGYFEGHDKATEEVECRFKKNMYELECGFKKTLADYNEKSIWVKEENAKLAIQVRKMDDMICANLQDIHEKEKQIKILNEKVNYLEESRTKAYLLINEMRNEKDEINEEANMMVAEKETTIDILKFFLRCRYDKDTARYEAIAKRTKNARIRKKAETKIIELKEQKLAFE